MQAEIDGFLNEVKHRVFGEHAAFENFRKRFFNRREPLFSLIQDHPLLGPIEGGGREFHTVLDWLTLTSVKWSTCLCSWEASSSEKPDRRLLLAAAEHVAVTTWRETAAGEEWLSQVLANCPELGDRMADSHWLEAREPLSRSERAVVFAERLIPKLKLTLMILSMLSRSTNRPLPACGGSRRSRKPPPGSIDFNRTQLGK